MATNLLRIHTKSIKISSPPTPFSLTKTLSFPSLPFPPIPHAPPQSLKLSAFNSPQIQNYSISPTLLLIFSHPTRLKRSSHSTSQNLSLNNLRLTSTKLKKPKEPRFRIEIPVIDDSPESLSQLPLDVFQDLPIKRKGSKVNILIIWPNLAFTEAAFKAFQAYPSTPVEHSDISSITNRNTIILSDADVAVFLAPEGTQLDAVKTVSDLFYPRPFVIFNPKWVFEDAAEFGELSGFVGSFEVIFSFMGLEVKGLLNQKEWSGFQVCERWSCEW